MRVGDTIAAPVTPIFPDREQSRFKFGYDIGTVIAIGKNKKTGKPAVRVQFKVSETQWVKRITQEPVFEKWYYEKDVDKI